MSSPETGDDVLDPAELVQRARGHLERATRAADADDDAGALDAVHQALGIASQLQVRAPGLHPVVAAPALHRLSTLESARGRTAEALGLAEQAIGLYRQLRAGAPGEHGDELATVLVHGAELALAEGQPDKAADQSAEAVTLLQDEPEHGDLLARARDIGERARTPADQ
jgi:tetratricopeptide (TPR) repeat protein